MGEHALLSASSSHRWLKCLPSARLEDQFKNVTSIFAEEGTAAHELSEYKLRCFLGIESKEHVSKFHGDEMKRYTDIYVDFAKEVITEARLKCKDTIILIEQRLDYSHYVPEGFGTGDLIIVADDTLDIIDLKYGKGIIVSAEDNTQMKLYSLGALNIFDSLYDIKKVRMTICQPRLENISTYEISVEELIHWAKIELKPKAELAIKGEGEFLVGEHCRFCRARYSCRARAEANLAMLKYDFKLPVLLSDEEIEEVLEISDRLSNWAKDIYAYASELSINSDKKWTGFKLVEGRANRKYTDEKMVIEACDMNGIIDIYSKSLLGVTAMEKLLGKKRFKDILGPFIEKPKGKPTLVPISDKRQEVKINNCAQNDFKGEF